MKESTKKFLGNVLNGLRGGPSGMLMNEERYKAKRKYEEEFCPILEKNDYGEAFKFLLKNPDIKAYLIPSDMATMYNYAESELIKLKGLEGKTKSGKITERELKEMELDYLAPSNNE